MGVSGNTPAYAGKTSYDENDPWEFLETPPPERGRQAKGSPRASRHRNTPAYAGKTAFSAVSVAFALETPPITRGRLLHVPDADRVDRNTPAYAGKTLRTPEELAR